MQLKRIERKKAINNHSQNQQLHIALVTYSYLDRNASINHRLNLPQALK